MINLLRTEERAEGLGQRQPCQSYSSSKGAGVPAWLQSGVFVRVRARG